MGKKIIIFFIFVMVLLMVYLTIAAPAADVSGTSGTAAGGATAATTDTTKDMTPADVKNDDYKKDFTGKVTGNSKIGNVVGAKDDKGVPSLKPEDITTSGNFDLQKKDGVTKITSPQSLLGKVGVGIEQTGTSIKTKENEIKGIQKGSEVGLNEKGKIVSAKDVRTNEANGDNIKSNGKEYNLPKGSKLNIDNNNKKAPITIEIEKAGTKISTVPKKDSKKDKDEEERNIQYRSKDFFTQLPDDVAKSMGFEKSKVEFKGIFSHNGDNWYFDKEKELTLRIDGKDVSMKNLFESQIKDPKDGLMKKLSGVSENTEVFFGSKSLSDAKTNGYNGAYFIFDKTGVGGGGSKELAGGSLQLTKDNPWGINVVDKGHMAAWAFKDSNFYFTKEGVVTNGKNIIDNDYISYRTDPETNKIFFNQGSKIPVTGFDSAKENFKDSINSPLRLIPFDNQGKPFPFTSSVQIGMSTDANPNQPTNFKTIAFGGNEKDISRVIYGEMPKDSKGIQIAPLDYVPPETPVTPPQPPTPEKPKPEEKPAGPQNQQQLIKSLGVRTIPNNPGPFNMFKEIGSPYDPAKHNIVILKFSNSGCPPCQDLARDSGLINFGNGKNNNIKIIPIDASQNPDLSIKYGIKGVPAIVQIDPSTGKMIGNIKVGIPPIKAALGIP